MSNTTTAAAASKQNEVRTPLTEFWRKFKKQKLAVGAGIFVLILVALAIFAPWIVPFDPENFFDYDALNAGPSLTHWLGVDSLGRDIFSRILMERGFRWPPASCRSPWAPSPAPSWA